MHEILHVISRVATADIDSSEDRVVFRLYFPIPVVDTCQEKG